MNLSFQGNLNNTIRFALQFTNVKMLVYSTVQKQY